MPTSNPPRVTRRDFLGGVALPIAGALAPADLLLRTTGSAAAQPAAAYPPALTGLRGMTDAAFDVMHAVAREGRRYEIDALAVAEEYDLVVVGAGLAGLTAAWSYKDRHPSARILVLDNNDDFGGHARRCELPAGGRTLLGYGGSETMVAPRTHYAGELARVLARLGIEPERFYDESVFHRTLYPGFGLSRGVFFERAQFGRDALVAGDPLILGFDEFSPANPNARDIAAFLADCPLEPATHAGLGELFAGTRDYLAGLDRERRMAQLTRITYRDFLLHVCGLPEQAASYFQGRLHDNYGLGIDAISAYDAMSGGLPGATAIGIADDLESHDEEPYVHHFPDGNATIARALVQALVPAVSPAGPIEQLVGARFDYARLDEPASDVRIRLAATAVVVRNEPGGRGGGVAIGYVRDGELRRVHAHKAIVATFAAVVPHICPQLAARTAEMFASNVRSPLLYIKVALTGWQSFARLGVHKIAAPTSFLSTVKLDYPVSFGSYRFARTPSEPIGLQLVHVPLAENQGHDARTQARMGRQWLLETPFAQIERRVREDLQRMLGAGGFEADRDITAITVNRWSHGYSYAPNVLFDDVAAIERDAERMREPLGNIAFANSDTAWDAYAHAAMTEAMRAAAEIG